MLLYKISIFTHCTSFGLKIPPSLPSPPLPSGKPSLASYSRTPPYRQAVNMATLLLQPLYSALNKSSVNLISYLKNPFNRATPFTRLNFCGPLTIRSKQSSTVLSLEQIDISFSCICCVIDHEFWHNIVKVAVNPQGDSRVDPQTN